MHSHSNRLRAPIFFQSIADLNGGDYGKKRAPQNGPESLFIHGLRASLVGKVLSDVR